MTNLNLGPLKMFAEREIQQRKHCVDALAIIQAAEGLQQNMSELTRQIAEKRAELETAGQEQYDGKLALAESRCAHKLREADARYSETERRTQALRDECAGLEAQVDSKKAELAAIESKITAARAALGG